MFKPILTWISVLSLLLSFSATSFAEMKKEEKTKLLKMIQHQQKKKNSRSWAQVLETLRVVISSSRGDTIFKTNGPAITPERIEKAIQALKRKKSNHQIRNLLRILAKASPKKPVKPYETCLPDFSPIFPPRVSENIQSVMNKTEAPIANPIHYNGSTLIEAMALTRNQKWENLETVGYNNRTSDLLLDLYLGEDEKMAYIYENGKISNPDAPAAYTHFIQIRNQDPEKQRDLLELKNIFAQIKTSNKKLPGRIFIPFQAVPSSGRKHAMLLVIENPSSGKPRIGVLNTLGKTYLGSTQAVADAAAQTFGYPESRKIVSIPGITQTDGYSCGLHAIENLRLLAKERQPLSAVEARKLPTRNTPEIKQAFESHQARYQKFLNDIGRGRYAGLRMVPN